MYRAYSITIILSLVFVLYGCSALQYLDGSTEEEIKIFKMNKKKMYNDLKRLEAENENLQREADTSTDMNQEFAQLSDENRSLNQEVNRLSEDNQRVVQENEELKRRLAENRMKDESSFSPDRKIEKDIGRLKIKVLSGNGNLNSAKNIAKKLKDAGYNILLIDRAPRSDFDKTTIYYASNLKDEAKRLMSNMHGTPVLKPLTWPTTFDLIVVTGLIE